MDRAFLTGLGIEKEVVDKIMEKNGALINSHNAAIENLKTDHKTAAETSKQTIKDMSDKVKSFDGVDIESLKKSAADWEIKYNTDTAQIKRDSALTLALRDAKVKNPKPVMAMLDNDKIKLDGDKLLGLDDQLKALKDSDAYLFDVETPPPAEITPPIKVSSGMPHGAPLSNNSDAELDKIARKAAGLK